MGIRLQYGPVDASFEQAAEFLRTTAEDNGLSLRPVAKTDQIAAVYAAEQWCLAHRTRTLAYPAVHGMPAVQSLAAILSRASGRRHMAGPMVDCLPDDDLWVALTEGLSEHEKTTALERAVSDLHYGNSEALTDWVTLRLGPATAADEGTGAA